MAKQTKKAVPPPASTTPARPLPPVDPIPSWYRHASATEAPRRIPHYSNALAYVLARGLLAGEYALPLWQRSEAWDMTRRIAFLDSMMHRVPSGTILLWTPPYKTEVPFRPLPGVETKPHPMLIVDGQQRLTTILMAARGDIPVYWDGTKWSDHGILSPAMGLAQSPPLGLYRSLCEAGLDPDPMTLAFDRLARFEMPACLLEYYPEEDARAAYERMAAGGVPHEDVDLEQALQYTSVDV